MGSFSIHVDTSSHRFLEAVAAGGNIASGIYISAQNICYPDIGYTDFVVVILGWWLQGSSALVDDGDKVENDFMDGPYQFTTEKLGNNVAIRLYQRTVNKTQQVGSTVVVLLNEYNDELYRAAQQLLKALDVLDASGTDIEVLRSTLKVL